MLLSIVLIPAILGILVFFIPSAPLRRVILLTGSGCHAGLLLFNAIFRNTVHPGTWIGLDAMGLLFLSITSILFAASAVYAAGYLGREAGLVQRDEEEGFLYSNEPDAVFIGCMLLFLSTMSLVCISREMELLWVAVEATTLVSAPLINYHRHHRSLEATWNYLLICSVGIAMALLGNFFLAYAGHDKVHLNIDSLISNAPMLDPLWLKAAFVMLLVGYGTKMGLAPMHTWLPGAHSEAPSMVSTLLSGALLNCAFLGILRGNSVLNAAGLGDFSGGLLIFFGILSMTVSALMLIRQVDYKRMLAYSSIEHMGILSLGVGIGGVAATGAMLHAVNHSLTKGMLFLCAGQMLHLYRTKITADVRNLLQTLPLTGFLWLAGFLAITGSPPFGIFISELTILKGAFEHGRWFVAAGYLILLAVVFIAMARITIPMVFGRADNQSLQTGTDSTGREALWFVIPAVTLGIMILVLGLFVPSQLWDFLSQAAFQAGGQ